MPDAFRVPEPLATDIDDVTDALDVAQSLWENGKRLDAIHWVKRAADSARTSDATRADALARSAQELEQSMQARSVPPPPVAVSKPPPPPQAAAQTMSRPPPPVPPPVPKVSKPPPPVPTARTSASVPPPAPPPPRVPTVSSPPPPIVQTPSVPPVQAAPPPAPSSSPRLSSPPAPTPRGSKAPPPQLLQQPASEDRVRVPSTSTSVAPKASGSTSIKMPIPSDQTLRVRATVRVSVKTSVRDASLLVVRPLADGAAVPAGAREALLTFVHDDTETDEAST